MNKNFDTTKFYDALKHGIVEFIFKKKDGSLRYAQGTTDLTEVDGNIPKGTGTPGPDYIKRFYDKTVEGWRSVNVNNIVWCCGDISLMILIQ